MKLGLCAGLEHAKTAAEAGFDYLEVPLNAVAAMPKADFMAFLAAPQSLPILKSNCFLPGALPVVGDHVSSDDLRAYLSTALSRAKRLGVKIAVFGSGAARSVPKGFSFDIAWRQVKDFLMLAAEYAERYAITIAIEPLRREECNLLNFVSEATLMASLIDSKRVCVLGDTFHMLCGGEPFSALTNAGKKLKHLHISRAPPDLSGRVYPAPDDGEDYAELFSLLTKMRYRGDISIEAGAIDLPRDAALAAACLKPLIGVLNPA